MDNFKPICPGNYKEIEKFADLLDITIVNLKEANCLEELNDGSLYMRNYPHPCYPRIINGYWRNKRVSQLILEKQKSESVENLREWVLQEAECQTKA